MMVRRYVGVGTVDSQATMGTEVCVLIVWWFWVTEFLERRWDAFRVLAQNCKEHRFKCASGEAHTLANEVNIVSEIEW